MEQRQSQVSYSQKIRYASASCL